MKKRLTAMLMALCLLAGMIPAGTIAHAASYVVYITSNLLTAYASPSTSARSLGVMSYGEAYVCLATSGNWARIRNSSGAVGYCLKAGLNTENPNTLNGKVYINTGGTKVYAKPSTGARVMMKLTKNSSYTARAVTADGQWYRLQNGKYYGYVQARYISGSQADSGGSTDSGNNGGTENGGTSFSAAVYVMDNVLKMYKSPSASSAAVATLGFGQGLVCTNVSGSWARVKYGSTYGYCALSSLSDINPNDLNYNIFINTSGVKVYALPHTSARVMMKLAKNSSYKALGITTDGQWYRLQNGKYYGYVQAQYISDDRITDTPAEDDESIAAYVGNDLIRIYKSDSTAAATLCIHAFGEDLTLISVDDGWAKVCCKDGTEGYTPYGGIATANPNKLNTVYYAQSDGVKIYALPAASTTPVQSVLTDAQMTVKAISSGGDWARVILGDGSIGYVQISNIGQEKVGLVADPNAIKDISPTVLYVSDTTMILYQTNSVASKILGTLSFGESVTATGSGGGWVRVQTANGTTGCCKLSGLTRSNPNTASLTVYVQKSGTKAYDKPSTSATSLGVLALNRDLTALCVSKEGDWVRVKNSSGVAFYVQSAYLSTSKVETSTSKTDAIVALAKQQLDKKYVYAAEGPNSFDCSGLTYYVFKKAAGVTLKRTAYQQGYDERYTKITSIAALRVGDIVFFNTSNDSDLCDHAGIYLGGNQFIHASSAGGRVMISSLSSSSNGGYYYKCFSWGRRIL